MTDPTELTVQGQAFSYLYTQYVAGVFVVNRRYQRKLVWSVEEKQSLVDSVRQNLPIPLVLLAESKGDGKRQEIIDGLQRLNAIFSFVENEFSYEGAYFDLETLADTKQLRDRKKLVQKTPVLDRDLCVGLVNYQLPVSIYRSASEESVDEVFRRINSSGRKLSAQEIRQAGVTSEVADLVRRISAGIRGDASYSDTLPLSEMPKISITSKELPYGIPSDEIFWVKNGILDRESVRQSRDEELVLDLVLDTMLESLPVTGSDYRNSSYDRDDKSSTSAATVEARMQMLGASNVESRFFETLDVIRQTIEHSTEPWVTWVITRKNPRSMPRYFQAIFVPTYELLFKDKLELADLAGLTEAMHKIWDGHLKTPSGGGNWSASIKRALFDSVKANLGPYFRESDDPVRMEAARTETEFEIELQKALTEHAMFELKQGFTRLDGSNSFDDDAFEKVLRTASAMANENNSEPGYIFFGVADRPEHAARIKDTYGVDSLTVGGFDVTGTQHELTALGRNVDTHMQWLVNRIKNSQLDAQFASELARTIVPFHYKGYLIWTLRPARREEPVSWSDAFHIREGNSTTELKGPQVAALMRKFLSA